MTSTNLYRFTKYILVGILIIGIINVLGSQLTMIAIPAFIIGFVAGAWNADNRETKYKDILEQ